MQIFKLFFKIFKSKIVMTFAYIIVFLILVTVLTNTGEENNTFVQTNVDFAIVDMDKTDSSKALSNYLCQNNTLVDVGKEKYDILDALFNERIHYAVVIKEGFEEKLAKGDISGAFENYQSPNNSSGQILSGQIERFAKTACAFVVEGNDVKTATQKTAKVLEDSVSVTIKTAENTENTDFSHNAMYYYQYLSYILISVIMTVICPVLLVMNKKDIKDRTNCSCVKFSSRSVQTAVASVVCCVAVWAVFNVAGIIITQPAFGDKLFLAALNSFVVMLISLGLSLVVLNFIKSENSVGMISNIVGLGMSFLCGVFVPQSLLGDKVLSVTRFLPLYWYVKVTDMLGGVSDVAFDFGVCLRYIAVEFAFCVMIFAIWIIGSAVNKTKN